jgi:hypothetical protein
VPFEAFRVRQDAIDGDDFVLNLAVNKEQLEGAEGFEDDRWSNFAPDYNTAASPASKSHQRHSGQGASELQVAVIHVISTIFGQIA